jgi:hypothetical protein
MRLLVKKSIERHLPKHQLDVLMAAEESEREVLNLLARQCVEGDLLG